jgi:hypothetical protein
MSETSVGIIPREERLKLVFRDDEAAAEAAADESVQNRGCCRCPDLAQRRQYKTSDK